MNVGSVVEAARRQEGGGGSGGMDRREWRDGGEMEITAWKCGGGVEAARWWWCGGSRVEVVEAAGWRCWGEGEVRGSEPERGAWLSGKVVLVYWGLPRASLLLLTLLHLHKNTPHHYTFASQLGGRL